MARGRAISEGSSGLMGNAMPAESVPSSILLTGAGIINVINRNFHVMATL